MASRLTEKAVERLCVRPAAYIVWDAATIGLGLKITPRDKRIWLAQLKYPGHRVQTRRTLGHYPALGLAEARRKAEEWYALAKNGIDPVAAEEENLRKAEAARRVEALKSENTFTSVAERYIAARHAKRRAKVDAEEIRRMLLRVWGDRPIHEILPRDVRELIDKIARSTPYGARNAWTHVVGIFKSAVHEELIDASPCASLDRRQLFKNVAIAHRQRVFNDDELRAFWHGSGRLDYPAGPFFRLLALTGVRVNELGKASWGELHPELRRLIRDAARSGHRVHWPTVSTEIKLWTVPRARFKSDAEHLVPLSDDACAILAELPRFAGCDFFFTVNGKTPVWFGTKFKRRLDALMLAEMQRLAVERGDDPKAVTLTGWIAHDLRRCVRSGLAALGVDDHIAELAIGHTRQGLQKIYDQHKYEREIGLALAHWAARLRATVEPGAPPLANVVALPQRRA